MDNSYLIFSLIGAAVLAFIPANIAKSKGRSFGAWYVYGFLLWIVAIIHAAALPYPQNIMSQTQPQQAPMRDVSQISPNQIVKAPRKITLSQDMNTDYDLNMPMDVLWYAIQKNEMSNIIYLEIKLISFFNSPIEALKFDIHCFDAFGDPVGKSNIYHALLQDLNIIPHEETFLNVIELHGFENTRSVKIDVTQVLLRSGIRNNTESRSVPAGQKWTGQDLENSTLLYGKNAVYKPEETEYGWNCTCGRPNSNSKVQCIRCQTKREDALKITSFLLKQLVIENEEKKLRAQNDDAQRDAERKRIRKEIAEKDRIQCEEDMTKRRKRIRRNVKIAAVASIVFALCVATFIIVTSMIIPGLKYNSAKALMANGDYEEAIMKFEDLGEYKDSSDQLVESKYLSAVDLLSNKKYQEAENAFVYLGNYKDSNNQAKQAKYSKAQDLLANKQYDEASALFAELGDYRDSVDQLDLAKYNKAQDLLANKQYDEASALFAELGDYRDSVDQLDQLYLAEYNKAQDLLANKQYGEASELFAELGDYRDSPDQFIESQYLLAQKHIEASEYSKASEILMHILNYKESSDLYYSIENSIVSASYRYTVGLKKDGTVVATGINDYGQCDTSEWTDIIAVSAGFEHTVGLKKDGTVVAIGRNDEDQCNTGEWTDIVTVSAGYHTVGLKKDGTVVATGNNDYDQCDTSEWTDIVAVYTAVAHTVGLKKDGTVVATGINDYGQCDTSEWTDIIAVSAECYQTVGLKKDGTVVAIGRNDVGQCDTGEWTDIVAVCAGGAHTVGLKKDGTVVATGYNVDGECNTSEWTDIMAVSAGTGYTVGLKKDGTFVAAGINDYGQCDITGWTGIGNTL